VGCIVGCPEGLIDAGDKLGVKEIEGAAVVGLVVVVGDGAAVVGAAVGAVDGLYEGFDDAALGLDDG